MIARDEVRDRIEARASDAEIDAAIVAAATAQGLPEVVPDFELRGCDDDAVWSIIDAAIDALKPKVAVIFTDRAVLSGSMFDPGSIARFVVDAAADDLRAEVWLVADPYADRDAADLIEWRKGLGIKLAPLGATRDRRDQHLGLISWLISTRPFERIVVADTLYRSDDPRVTVHRRVTR